MNTIQRAKLPANVQELLGAHFRAAISLQRLAHTNTALAAQHVFGFRKGRQRRVNSGAEGLTMIKGRWPGGHEAKDGVTTQE